jgi:hypothetical protein
VLRVAGTDLGTYWPVLLVLDVVVDRIGAITATGVPLAVFVGLWVGLPLQLRRT